MREKWWVRALLRIQKMFPGAWNRLRELAAPTPAEITETYVLRPRTEVCSIPSSREEVIDSKVLGIYWKEIDEFPAPWQYRKDGPACVVWILSAVFALISLVCVCDTFELAGLAAAGCFLFGTFPILFLLGKVTFVLNRLYATWQYNKMIDVFRAEVSESMNDVGVFRYIEDKANRAMADTIRENDMNMANSSCWGLKSVYHFKEFRDLVAAKVAEMAVLAKDEDPELPSDIAREAASVCAEGQNLLKMIDERLASGRKRLEGARVRIAGACDRGAEAAKKRAYETANADKIDSELRARVIEGVEVELLGVRNGIRERLVEEKKVLFLEK
ncbi:MAG: hypothetical protein WC797_02045 [Candidatus Paceibacterota bacterium]|jgi:hypothetical protein